MQAVWRRCGMWRTTSASVHPGRHRRSRDGGRFFVSIARRLSSTSPRRRTSIARSTVPSIRRDQPRGHLRAARLCAAILVVAGCRRPASDSGSFMSPPTRSMARSAAKGRFRGDLSRPDSRSLAAKAGADHLVAYQHTYGLTHTDHELFEQLRAVSVSRKANPADDRTTRMEGRKRCPSMAMA